MREESLPVLRVCFSMEAQRMHNAHRRKSEVADRNDAKAMFGNVFCRRCLTGAVFGGRYRRALATNSIEIPLTAEEKKL